MKSLKWMGLLGLLPLFIIFFSVAAILFMVISGSSDNSKTEYDSAASAQQLVDTALAEYGAIGGDKYRTWYTGTADGQPWCATFISWCANECGLLDTVTIPRFQSCNAGVAWFSERNQFIYTRTYGGDEYMPQTGDIIFFTGNHSRGNSTHVGIVQYVDDDMNVVTIEGNTSNGVFDRKYTLDNPYILGYGIPNYPSYVDFTGNSNAEIAWNFFISKGCNEYAAAGILGNLQQESGIVPTSAQLGGGPGRGIAQWTVNESRYNDLVSYATERGEDWTSLEIQLEFLWEELNGRDATTYRILNQRFGGITTFKRAPSIEWAVEAFEKSYERAGSPNTQQRVSYAYSYYNQFSG